MMSIFRKLMPRGDRFFDLFSKHSETVFKAAGSPDQLFVGTGVERNCDLSLPSPGTKATLLLFDPRDQRRRNGSRITWHGRFSGRVI